MIDRMKRAWTRAGEHQIGLVAAGVAFYWFLAMIPLIGAMVLTYGLVASPEVLGRHMDAIATMLPGEAATLVQDQLEAAVSGSGSAKGLGLLLSLGFALFGARNGAGSLILALNIANDCKDQRGFISRNLVALGITALSALGAIFVALTIAALGLLENLLPTNLVVANVLKVVSYLVLGAILMVTAAMLYRYGPACGSDKVRWKGLGPFLAALGIGVLTLGFGIYVANFGNYNATYGSLGAVVVLLTWLWLSAYVLLLGAEVDAVRPRSSVSP